MSLSIQRYLHILPSALLALMAAGVAAQAPSSPSPPTPAEASVTRPPDTLEHRTPLEQRTQRLIDAFIGVMPQSPTALRNRAERERLAPAALPILRRVRDHVMLHGDSMIAPRVHEFTVYALVLGDETLRSSLTELRQDGDGNAALLLNAANLILAADSESRSSAVAACAKSLAEAESRPVAACAVQCMVVTAQLNHQEASALAKSCTDEALAEMLQQTAKLAAQDARQWLDKPFSIEGTQPDGTPFSTRSLHGKVVLIDFWATWCGPCLKALPELLRLHREHGEALAIVGVSCDHDLAALRRFLQEHPEVDWPQLYAEGKWHPAATSLGVDSIPRLFLIDRAGVLRSIDAAEDLDAQLRRLLAD